MPRYRHNHYSIPLQRAVQLEELHAHLFTLPDRPDWIPYRTSYCKKNWGSCLSHKQFLELADEEYKVCINASLEEGIWHTVSISCQVRHETKYCSRATFATRSCATTISLG
jgi:aminopeptidase-like protein